MAQLSGAGEIDFAYIGRVVLLTLGLYLISALFLYIQGWLMANVSTDISYRFRQDISKKMNRMPLKYFDATTHGEVLSRITNDVDTVNQTLSQSLTQIITSLVTVVGVLIMMFSISWLDDARRAGHHPALDGDSDADREAIAEIFQTTAGLPRSRQRARGRNVRRPHRDEGLQRRAAKASRSSISRTTTCTTRPGNLNSFRV
jgi:ABC-type multidrug transport system fused ATPase/permease subunit